METYFISKVPHLRALMIGSALQTFHAFSAHSNHQRSYYTLSMAESLYCCQFVPSALSTSSRQQLSSNFTIIIKCRSHSVSHSHPFPLYLSLSFPTPCHVGFHSFTHQYHTGQKAFCRPIMPLMLWAH